MVHLLNADQKEKTNERRVMFKPSIPKVVYSDLSGQLEPARGLCWQKKLMVQEM